MNIYSDEMSILLKEFDTKVNLSQGNNARIPLDVKRRLSQILTRFMLPEVADLEIRRYDSGRPYLYSSQFKEHLPLISISHSGAWIGIVLSRGDAYATIDLEDMSIARSYLDIAKNFFSQSENNLISAEDKLGFYKIWTAKEAIAKCLNQPIAQVLRFDLGDLLSNKPLASPFVAQILGGSYELYQGIIEGDLFYTTCYVIRTKS